MVINLKGKFIVEDYELKFLNNFKNLKHMYTSAKKYIEVLHDESQTCTNRDI